jgi:hypothetical protein
MDLLYLLYTLPVLVDNVTAGLGGMDSQCSSSPTGGFPSRTVDRQGTGRSLSRARETSTELCRVLGVVLMDVLLRNVMPTDHAKCR